jgi:hypothetical protein
VGDSEQIGATSGDMGSAAQLRNVVDLISLSSLSSSSELSSCQWSCHSIVFSSGQRAASGSPEATTARTVLSSFQRQQAAGRARAKRFA